MGTAASSEVQCTPGATRASDNRYRSQLFMVCMQRQDSADEGVVTVHAAIHNSLPAEHDIFDRLSRLPQVKQVNSSKGPEDQLWRELTSYSQGSPTRSECVCDLTTLTFWFFCRSVAARPCPHSEAAEHIQGEILSCVCQYTAESVEICFDTDLVQVTSQSGGTATGKAEQAFLGALKAIHCSNALTSLPFTATITAGICKQQN